VLIAALEALRHPKSSACATQTQALSTKLERCASKLEGGTTHVVHASSKGCANQIQVQQAPDFEDDRGKFSTEEPPKAQKPLTGNPFGG
jgi:hypothetical protein